MKRLIGILLITLFAVTGCKKFLTTKPVDFVDPEGNFQTESQLMSALAGVYDVLGQNRLRLYANEMYTSLNASNDLSFYGRSSQTTGPEVYNFDFTDNVINDTWQALYTGIERANNLIAYINVSKSISETDRNAILGETFFLRGYYYFLLVSNFGDVPMRLEPTTLTGVPSVDVPRTKSADVYNQILNDMSDGYNLVYPATHFGDASRINKSIVNGIRARVALTMAGYPLQDTKMYDSAMVWSKAVIDSKLHNLKPDYSQVFIDELQKTYDATNRNILWEAQFFGNSAQIYQEEGRLGNTNGIQFVNVAKQADSGYSYGFIYATRKLYQLYKNGDLRRDWAIAPYKYNNAGDRVANGSFLYDRNVGKWRRSYEQPSPKDKNFTGTNFPILRYSDVLLMYAEAANAVNNAPSGEAYEAFNQVRRRAFGFPIDVPNPISDLSFGLDKTSFQNEIIDERARELCFESLRRADLIRWGIWQQTMRETSIRMHNELDGNTTWSYATLGADNAASSDRYLLYPIPSSERSVNKTITQNPGY